MWDACGPLGLLLAVLFTIIVHEAGHLLMARILRIRIGYVSIGLGPTMWRRDIESGAYVELRAFPVSMGVGILARRQSDGSVIRPAWHDALVGLAGPTSNFVQALALFILAIIARDTPVVDWALPLVALALGVGILNLIPFPGLDGGQLAVLLLDKLGLRWSPQQEKAIHRRGLQVGAVICALLIVVSVGGVWS